MGNKQPGEDDHNEFNLDFLNTKKNIKSNHCSPKKTFKEDELTIKKQSHSEKKEEYIFSLDKPFEKFDSKIF